MRRAERTMVLVRWAGVVFAVVQVLAYRERPYPPGVRASALGVAALLAAANLIIWMASRRVGTLRGARVLALVALAVDIAATSGFVWLYAFDPLSALWAILFVIPLEGAIRFGLRGAIASWAAITVLYLARELWRVEAFPGSVTGPGGFGFQWESVSFRMGIGLLIALVGGLMARDLMRQRAQLAETLLELWKIDVLRSRMVAMLAHDVRNPLTTIRGTMKTLARYGDRVDPQTHADLLATADKQAERIERLAGDLLDLARTERGRLHLDLADVPLRDAVDRGLSFLEDGDRFDLDVPDGLAVRADPQRLEQIVVNLATNALRYGKDPLEIAATPRGKMVELTFTDHGPGIPPDDVELLFEPFRADSDRGSVGLGLAIVRALTEAQGGSVSCEANEPRGARFRITLPSASV
jgi:signal transduction histidine kinase